MSYEIEKLGLAVDCLISAAPMQKRIEYAWTSMHTLRHHQWADKQRKAEYDLIYDACTADKSDEQAGYMPTTTSRLNEEAAEKIADDIFELYQTLLSDERIALEDEVARLKHANG